MRMISTIAVFSSLIFCLVIPADAQSRRTQIKDAKNVATGKPAPPENPEFRQYGIYKKTAKRATEAPPIPTVLPLSLKKRNKIAFLGNTLLERSQHFGYFESAMHTHFPEHQLSVRNLAWPADTPDLQPRPDNFADWDQHLTREKTDVIFAAFGFNESFAGADGAEAFEQSLASFVNQLKTRAFNEKSSPRIILISPIANENVDGSDAADRNNENLQLYSEIIRKVAQSQNVGFVDAFTPTNRGMAADTEPWTINGSHLNDRGYREFAKILFQGVFGEEPDLGSERFETIRQTVIDKNRQYFRRYRPLNTFYYTGGRNKSYGYLDFLPAMRNFDRMVVNRDHRIWDLALGKRVSPTVDDSNVPELPITKQSRGANRWITADEERKNFKIDPRFEINLFAGEEQFPDIGAPIQIRWDSRGRLWVSCSTTYPHVYPGKEPNDKLVILEDTDQDGKADKSTVFADDLHIPLSFEFGDGGVYVSEMPHLTFIKDTDGDGKADDRRILLSGFGTEDSHHSLHDFTWTPDGDLIFREGIFHHTQVETTYGPVRQRNSGWFRFEPRKHKLTSFGTYHSTNPWGVTFDKWGQHVASHPIFAAAFHATDPAYPDQHPRPQGLRAYSGTCGQEFVDFATFPNEMQGQFIKVRYKPTNRVEIHQWNEQAFGYDEEYVGDLIFSSNLSFIPVDIRFGPRGALYVCDWYNPIKGHAQYSLRDERRDRHSGRIWRITTKGKSLQTPPTFADASIEELLAILKRPEYRYRYWAKRELRLKDKQTVRQSLDRWVADLDPQHPEHRHHQIEAIWTYRWIDEVNTELLRDVLKCDHHQARAAAVQQLRYWYRYLPHVHGLLKKAANDANAMVRMEAVIAASYVGTKAALDAVLDVFHYPSDAHLAYAIRCALGSAALKRHWEGNENYKIARLLRRAEKSVALKEPTPSARQAEFDTQQNLKLVRISCIPERMLFSVDQFAVTTGQPVKIVFTNPDATDHNWVLVQPGALAEVGMAANEMAKNPKFANSDFIPKSKRSLILQASPMIGPTRKTQVHVMRFQAPTKPGIYPYVCTFPGHWVVMKGEIIVAHRLEDVPSMLAKRAPQEVKKWTLADFTKFDTTHDPQSIMRGMQAFTKAKCNQCHAVAGHGVNLGPELKDVSKRYKGLKLLRQLVEPSSEINKDYQTYQFLLETGRTVSGVIVKETEEHYDVVSNLLTPEKVTTISKSQVEEKIASNISSMPEGLLNVLTAKEISDLVSFLEVGEYKLPDHRKHQHPHE